MADPLPEEIDDILWQEACRQAEVIRETLKDSTYQTTAADIKYLRDKLGLSRSSIFRLIKQFRENGTTIALVDRKRGRPAGHRALDSQREGMIDKAMRKYYLKPTRPSVSQLVRDIQTDCTVAGLKPPHRRTIETRLNDLDLRQPALRRGEKKLEKKARAVPGKLHASKPLDIVPIDHSKADIFVVDEETRKPIGRPWLTLAMDVFSRMVTGFYLTMEAPSRLCTSLCLLYSVYDKTAWLKERNIEEPWPVVT